MYWTSLGYPGSVRWQHLLASQIRVVDLRCADVDVATRYRVERLIGSQANYGIKPKTMIHFYDTILWKVFNVELLFKQ